MMRRPFASAAMLAVVLHVPGVALAQSTTSPAPEPPATQGQAVPAPDGAQGSDPCAVRPGTGDAGGSLSGQLSNCGGVLTPPAMSDGGIHVPAPDPDPNTTPVIPPNAVPSQPANPG